MLCILYEVSHSAPKYIFLVQISFWKPLLAEHVQPSCSSGTQKLQVRLKGGGPKPYLKERSTARTQETLFFSLDEEEKHLLDQGRYQLHQPFPWACGVRTLVQPDLLLFPQVEYKSISCILLLNGRRRRGRKNKSRGKQWSLCVVLRPGEGGKFYHTRQGWKKVELITKIRA